MLLTVKFCIATLRILALFRAFLGALRLRGASAQTEPS